MKRFLVLSFILAMVPSFLIGCMNNQTVHTSEEKVFYSEEGIRVGSVPDQDPIVAIFQNRTEEDAIITVAGGLASHKWEIPAGKNRSLRLENLGGEISFLIEFDTLSSVSVVLNLDQGRKTRRI